MNREDIIRMAREAGLVKQTQSGKEIWMADPEVLLEFGQLIEAEEGLAQYKHGYAAGAAAEREACAKECENHKVGLSSYFEIDERIQECADAIRARGQV